MWISHNGIGDPSIAGDSIVEVRFRDGITAISYCHNWDQNWQWHGSCDGEIAEGAIVAYRVIDDRDELRQIVLNYVAHRFSSQSAAQLWYEQGVVAGFGDASPEALVASGKASQLLDALDAIEAGVHS